MTRSCSDRMTAASRHIHHSWKENGVLFLEFLWKELIGKKRVVQWSRGSVLKILNFSREEETAAEGTVLALMGCSQALTACLLPVLWKIMGPTQAKQDEQSKGISTWDGDAGCLAAYLLSTPVSGVFVPLEIWSVKKFLFYLQILWSLTPVLY